MSYSRWIHFQWVLFFWFFLVCHSHFVFVYFPASFFKGRRMCLLLFLCPSSCCPPVIPLSAVFIWSSRAPCVREALIQPKPHLNKSHSRICFFCPQEVLDILKRLLERDVRTDAYHRHHLQQDGWTVNMFWRRARMSSDTAWMNYKCNMIVWSAEAHWLELCQSYT